MDDKTVFEAAPQGSLRPGVRLNGGMFEIERLIAEGGMGEVYKGVATASGDPVAIKLVRPEMARHPDVMALFKREANILHNLQHDAIPRYYVFSIEPELQRPYIAMEFVDGVSLQKRLSAGPMSSNDVRVLLRRIGGALDVAHARGVVHRDVSSDNIILPDGDPRRAKIVDFGIARAAQAPEGTILGDGFAGKYNYVSPEQLGLAGGEVTSKSDMYSFGLVVAEALRGKPIDMGGSQAEVIDKRRRVPDLSDIDIALRPLLTAMLAPEPGDRPASMAEVAAWGETGERTTLATPLAAKPVARSASPRGGKMAMAVVLVALVGAAAAAFWQRDALRSALFATEPAIAPRLPPLPPVVSETTPTPTPAPTPTPTNPPPSSPATPVQVESPSVQVLLEQLPPKPAQAELALAMRAGAAAARVDLPTFDDPGGKGVALHVTGSLPAGLSFSDLGRGHSTLEGAPAAPGRFNFEVVAVSSAGKIARMKVALDVSAAPPQPSQSVVDLAPATVGLIYSAGLPPFRSTEALALRALGLPDGLAFADLGGGLSQLAGVPTKAGKFGFEIVATAKGGAQARMMANIEVAPAPVATETPPAVVTPSPAPTPSLAAFLKGYDGGACFAVRQAENDGSRFIALGAERAAFERLQGAFKAALGREPQFNAELITQEQCPVATLMKPAPEGPPPRLTLDSPQVGKGQPLSGAVSGLSGRQLLLLAVTDDGRAVKLRVLPSPGGDAASFNVALSGDASSLGKPQVLLAIVSARPLAGLDAFRAGPSADVLREIGAQWREANGAAALALFKLVE